MDVQKNLAKMDFFSEAVDFLNEEEQEFMLERARKEAEKIVVPTVPCQCHMCDNWIDETELYHIIGWNDEKIICLECAEPIYIREEMPVTLQEYYED